MQTGVIRNMLLSSMVSHGTKQESWKEGENRGHDGGDQGTHSLIESPLEGFQLLMPFQFEGTCSHEETEVDISGE